MTESPEGDGNGGDDPQPLEEPLTAEELEALEEPMQKGLNSDKELADLQDAIEERRPE